LNQQFNVQAKNQVWARDMTYVYTALCEQALRLAIHRRQPKRGLLFHSDRGAKYSSRAFRQCPEDFGIKQIQSRAGK
ncbi:transposase, partial [Aggregatibacter actinomycetemcomitans]|nr:transposase [Aggregatibacter actinomycetemcomitans]